jgi:uncharacterized repeat protein (TIGR01451 family)/CSLREA domain-containing protein
MRRALLSFLVSIFVVLLGFPGVALAAPEDFTVNVTADHDDGSCDAWLADADCTLREAINAANADIGPSTISFDINRAPVGSVQTIAVSSDLPPITAPVTIDGYTEPGASANTLRLSEGDDAVLLIKLEGSSTAFVGLTLNSDGSTIRGLDIVGFGFAGILVNSANENVIQGNFIGVDPTGSTAAANSYGVDMQNLLKPPAGNTIGGPAPEARNVISGNSNTGVNAFEATGTVVQGNYVGTSASGDAAVGNVPTGLIVLDGLVGGTDPDDGNLISGNVGTGLFAGNTLVQGNLIGTNADASAAIGNHNGVSLFGGTVIGGSAPGAGNVISGNSQLGVEAFGPFTAEGNWIGTNQTGTLDLGNQIGGLLVSGATDRSLISGNTVAFNDGVGMSVQGGNGQEMGGNAVYANSGLGIDLDPSGVASNDAGDGDAGPNGLQNYPVVTLAAPSLGGTDVQGTLNSTPSTTFDVEAFSSPSCDPSGNGEGQTYLGTFQVATDVSGNASFDQQFAAPSPIGSVVTATATDPDGNTSEFSGCRTVAKAKTDLSVTKEGAPNVVMAGEDVTYTLTVSNGGPNAASNVALSDPLPSTTFFVSSSASQGSCSGTNVVICSLGTIPKNGVATITIVARLSSTGSVTNTATVNGAETDTDLTNNTASAITIVTPNGDGCTIVGTDGNDFLTGTSGDDVICGLGGSDTLVGKKGNDLLMGGVGNDVLKGGPGNDDAYGEDGNDTAVGAQGFDNVFGGIGADVLKIKDGAGGNDSADGGVDADVDVCKSDTGDTVTNCP